MRNKAIPENGGTLKPVPDSYKYQEMCNKAAYNYPHALEFVSECFMTRDVFDSIPNQHETEM